ncbi:DUF6221 family protein [Nocardia nova]|uniref:DUF6221 family protein n=1 Tax=Nocardia nova TaxID=37330 RepID=UPI0037A98E28
MTPDDFLSRLSAGLDRDDQLARAADKTRWLPEDKGITFEVDDMESDYSGRLAADTRANMDHIAHHSPARTLRQVEAIRKAVEEYQRRLPPPDDPALELDEVYRASWTGFQVAGELFLSALASIYADPAETGGES